MPKSLSIAIPIYYLGWISLQKVQDSSEERTTTTIHGERELPIVPYNDILKGTNGFSKANVLGTGRCGTVYKGILEN